MQRTVSAILLALAIPARAEAGAWVRPLGSVYASAGVARFAGTASAELTGLPEEGFESLAVELYAEVGLGAALELDVSGRWLRNALETEASSGLGDVEVALRFAPINGARALSFLLGARFPAYGEAAAGVPLGPGGGDVLTGVALGASFAEGRGWIGGELLHRLRVGGGASSALRTRVELGFNLHERVALAADTALQPAFGREGDLDPGAPGPIPLQWSLGAKLIARLAAGLALSAEVTLMPPALNDGPGLRTAAALVYELR